MSRPLHAVVVVVILSLGIRPSHAQAPASPPPQTALEEATQLTQQVEKLYQEGKYRDAMAPALRALALREKALGPSHPAVGESLSNLGVLYQTQGAYARAEPLFIRALDILEKAVGPMHPDVATSLNNLAVIYEAEGAYAKAEPLLVRALDIREKTLGPNHPDVALGMNNLAVIYKAEGAYARAEALLVRALDIREKTLGPNHPDVAVTLDNLAVVHQDQGAYAKAEAFVVRGLGIREKALGPDHPDVAASLNNLATLQQAQGAYAKAEPLLVRALGIREKAFGPNHPDVALSLNNLAALYEILGAYAKAEPLYLRALQIHEDVFGPMHPHVASSLNNLAGLYKAQGAYAKAEPLHLRALNINEKMLGPMHPQVAICASNLAMLYLAQGAYARAEPLLIRARNILEKALGPNHPDVATSLGNLAGVYREQGAHARAEALYLRALAIQEKAFGAMHPGVATAMNNLATLYWDQDSYARAERYFLRALEIREATLGGRHTDVAGVLHNLAVLYQSQGAYAKAEPLYLRALEIYEGAYGPVHPDIANTLHYLATLHQMRGEHVQAEALFTRCADIREQQLRNDLGRVSDGRRRDMIRQLHGETDAVVSFHADTISSRDSALELALTTILRRKGRIVDSLVDSDAVLRTHITPHLRGLFDQLSQTRSELIARLYAPAGPSSSTTANRDEIAALRTRIDDLENQLGAANDDFRTQAAPVTITAVQSALPAEAALVEFVRYRRFDPRQPQAPWQEERYVAYLLTRQGPPRWVALGDAVPIDAAIDAVLTAMDSRISAATVTVRLRQLDARVLAPVRAQLPGVSHLILAPDGKLNLVPFAALTDAQGHPAVERYLVSYVSSGRDLLRLGARQPQSPAAILAGPDYGPPPRPHAGTLSFSPLDGATAEATDLRAYFVTAPVTGADATKAALARLVGPAMLHIATHGFYGWPAGIAAAATRGARSPAAPRRARMALGSLSPPLIRDPAEGLDQSGLAMAGANLGASGLVTAREIAGYDWWGTQLVVLSACRTGVGAVPSGDGVYGLRRALVLAGAASQVVSLWSVSDAATRALMRDYYSELQQGTGRAEALRQAQLRMLQRHETEHPFYWAAFIPAGDWHPLDAAIFP